MAFKLPPIPIVIAAVCLVLALIFQIVGIAGSGWLVLYGGNTGYGLFRACAALLGSTACGSIDTSLPPWDVDWFKAVQAFSILGFLAVLGAVALAVIHFFKETGLHTLVAAILSGVAACCMLIEFAVYAGEMTPLPDQFGYGYGFILTIIACIASGAAAALFFVAKSSATSAM